MNTRIKELAEAAYREVVCNPLNDFISRELVDQRFAELIVQECIELNRQELAFNAFERVLNKYTEHFGVEE